MDLVLFYILNSWLQRDLFLIPILPLVPFKCKEIQFNNLNSPAEIHNKPINSLAVQ